MTCHHIPSVRCPECVDNRPSMGYWPAWQQSCQHCYCIKAEMTSGRTVPHMRCCKCGDERAAAGAVTW